MFAKMIPAKRVTAGNGKTVTAKLTDNPVEYFTPTPEDIAELLKKDGSLDKVEVAEADQGGFQSGLPVYADERINWLMVAMNSAAQVKARGGFTVEGEKEGELKVIVGDLPQSFEDLLASDRQGGPYMVQKAAFLAAFKVWAEDGGVNRPAQYMRTLGRPSLQGIDPKALKVIPLKIQAFLDSVDGTEEEINSQWGVYLNALTRQLAPTEEEEDWSTD